MDRNDSNPGMVERQMDETPMEGRSVEREGGSGTDRDHLQRGDSIEREGMQGGGSDRDDSGSVEREGLQGGGIDRDSMERGGSVDREGFQGSGSDRDRMQGSERDRDGMGGMEGGDVRHRMGSDESGGAMEGVSESDREIMHGRSPNRDDLGTPSDRLGDLEVNRDTLEGSSRDGGQGSDREPGMSDSQRGGDTPQRDW